MKHIILALYAVLPISGVCQEATPVPNTLPELMEAMNESASRRSKEARLTSVPLMSLSVMFEDENVRRLARAAGRGDIETIDQLVSEGVDVNARGTRNATPLYWALRNTNGFRRLLEHGADPNVVYDDDDRTSVMHAAIEQRDADFLRLALAHGGDPNLRAGSTDETPIFKAVQPYGNNKLTLLIEAGADLNARGHLGYTPVLSAVIGRDYDSALTLLEIGADHSLRNDYGRGLVDFIVINRPLMDPDSEQWQWMLRVSDWLRDHGVDVPE